MLGVSYLMADRVLLTQIFDIPKSLLSFLDILLNFLKYLRSFSFPRTVISAFTVLFYLCAKIEVV